MAQTTKRAIAASLKRLLEQKPLNKITVTDIAKDCHISRHTFYYHFRDVYDLMEWTYRTEGERLLEGRRDYDNWRQGMADVYKRQDEGKQVLDIIAKLATYTDPTVPANANNQDFTKNQQLILDNKAVFMPNGTWVVGEMAEAPRAEGFEWGFTAIPAVTEGGDAYGVAWIEQAWIPAAAEHKDCLLYTSRCV